MKNPLSKLQKQADKEFQALGRRLKPFCEVCGKPSQVVHHYFPKSVSSRLRYEMENGIVLCNGCHMRHHQAGDPRIHGTIIKQRGIKWHEKLLKLKGEIVKVNRQFYEDAIQKFENWPIQ